MVNAACLQENVTNVSRLVGITLVKIDYFSVFYFELMCYSQRALMVFSPLFVNSTRPPEAAVM